MEFGDGKRELARLGLVDEARVETGYVVRMPKAYPVYYENYRSNVDVLRAWLAANAANVHPVGRNGMHKYNNQDHSMMTAMLCAKNILAGERRYDLWRVNEDAEYHESGEHGASSSGLRQVPRAVAAVAAVAAAAFQTTL